MWIDTDCNGNRACYRSNINANWGVMCDAHYSCSKSDIMSYQNIECNGKGSCHDSVMNSTKYNGISKVNINGHYAAAKARIYSDLIHGFGYHSFIFATIDSMARDQMTVHAFGHHAGYGATVICRKNSKCSLICKGSGCYNLDFLCMHGATCILSPTKCRGDQADTFNGIECPNMMKDVSSDDYDQFKKRKAFNLKNDEIYGKYKNRITNNNEEFHSLGNILVEFEEEEIEETTEQENDGEDVVEDEDEEIDEDEVVDNEPEDVISDEPEDVIADEPEDVFGDEPENMFGDEPEDVFDEEPQDLREPENVIVDEPESVFGEEPQDLREPEDIIDDEPENQFGAVFEEEPEDEVEALPVIDDEASTDDETETEISTQTNVCTCQETTKEECEGTGDFKNKINKGECTWQASHAKCRNTEWLECKQDPKCLWMQITPKCHKTKQKLKEQILDQVQVQEIENEKVDFIEDEEVDIAYDHEEEEYIEEEYIDENDENEMIVNRSGMLSSSIRTQSDNIRIYAFCAVIMFLCGAGIYHLFGKRKKDGMLYAVNNTQNNLNYSTF